MGTLAVVEQYAAEIKAFIVSNFLFGQEGGGFADDQSLLESGVVDSTGLLELVAFIEERYGIAVGDQELVPETSTRCATSASSSSANAAP